MFDDKQKSELAKGLDSKHVKPAAPGKYGEYIEGWRTIDEANRIFGFDGWSRETVILEEKCRELVELPGKNGGAPYKQWRVGYFAKVSVHAGGIVREGSGFGHGQGKPEALSDAIESAIKEAETDAMKRALMTFGNPFGLALYDKTKANVVDTPAPTITDDQRDIIMGLAPAAGLSLQVICEHYEIAALPDLPASKFADCRKRLDTEIAKARKAGGEERKAA